MGCCCSSLPNWPKSIEVVCDIYQNTARELEVGRVWTSYPKTIEEIITVVNWAVANKYKVRASGTRMSWAPLTVDPGDSPRAILIDTTRYFNKVLSVDAAARTFVVQPGAIFQTVFDALTTATPALSLPFCVGTGYMTIGGAVVASARGAAVPATPDTDARDCIYGTMSNLVVGYKAVVSAGPGGQYVVRDFTRESDGGLMVAGIGRTFIVELTMKAIPQYNLRMLSTMDWNAKDLFAAPGTPPTAAAEEPSAAAATVSSANGGKVPTFAELALTYGRIQTLWLPLTGGQVWTRWAYRCDTKPEASREVTHAYNYPYQDNVPPWMTNIIEGIVGLPRESLFEQICDAIATPFDKGGPSPLRELGEDWTDVTNWVRREIGLQKAQTKVMTPLWMELEAKFMNLGQNAFKATDLWGPSQFHLLCTNTGLRFTTTGFTILIERGNLQLTAHTFWTACEELLAEYRAQGLFPINLPIEFRVNGLDQGVPLSPLNADPSKPWDTAFSVDVVSLPTTPGYFEYIEKLVAKLRAAPALANARVLTEWSKPFAVDKTGPWRNVAEMKKIRELTPGFADAAAAFARYDGSNLFTNKTLTWALDDPLA